MKDFSLNGGDTTETSHPGGRGGGKEYMGNFRVRSALKLEF